MNRNLLISMYFLVVSGVFASSNLTDSLDPTRIANDLFNQFEEQGRLGNLTAEQEREVKEVLKATVDAQLVRVATGELSLDPNAPNYFLIDTIKSSFDAIKNLASKIENTVLNIGKKVFNGLKGVLGTVVHAGLSFLSIIDNDFIKGVIGTAAGALGKAISSFGPLIADAAVAIPVIGPELAIAGNLVLPWVDKVLNKENVVAAADVIGKLANAMLITKDAIKDAAAANYAPRSDAGLLAISEKASSKEATKAQKADGGKKLAKLCHQMMTYLSKQKADDYNKLPANVKTVAAQCNHWATMINIQGEK